MPFGRDSTGYSAACRDDGSFDVVRVKPHGSPQRVGTFATSAKAQHWIFELIVPQEPNRANAPV